MEVYKRKLLLESLIDRSSGINYGVMTGNTFQINFFLKQTIEDMGMFTDVEVSDEPISYPLSLGGVPNENNPLIGKLLESGYIFNFMYDTLPPSTPLVISDFYSPNNIRISAMTSSRLTELEKYDATNPYEEFFLLDNEDYIDYQGNSIGGVSTVFDLGTPNYTGYTFDGDNNAVLGTINQTSGLLYRDLGGLITNIDDELNVTLYAPSAYISYIAQGWNETNTSLSANIKEEKYLGVVFPPEVESEVFIERGITSVLESHLRLSEIESLDHLENYNNGSFYNINKQTI